MTSTITRLLRNLFPFNREKAFRALLVGLDASGRSTFLYHSKLGEAPVCTIPTIGFNVETIHHHGYDLNLWDIGGCDKIRPLWRHYFQSVDVLCFFIDSNDLGRIDQARDELRQLMNEEELQNAPIVLVANKQDLPNALNVEEIRARFGELALGRWKDKFAIIPTCATEGTGLAEVLDKIVEISIGKRTTTTESTAVAGINTKNDDQEASSNDISPSRKEETSPDKVYSAARKAEVTFMEWLECKDDGDDIFLSRFADYTLDSWDHRTHLRIAWLLLKRHGRKDGMKKIFVGIRQFIENSDRTKRSSGTTFHETMTYFWVHMIHYAIMATNIPNADDNNFRTFLLLNPQLANGGLFLHYYTKKLMLQTSESRQQVVLPDIRPLPSLITDIASSRLGNQETPMSQSTTAVFPVRAAPLSDDEFLLRWTENQLTSWGHENRLRAIWLCLSRHGRRDGLKRAFDGLEKSDGIQNHHLTATYFWIQMVDYTIHKINVAIGSGCSEKPRSFNIFIQNRLAQPLRNPNLIAKYFTQKVLDMGKSKMEFSNLQKMPSIVD